MIKILSYYQNQEELDKAEEPYGTIAEIIDGLYLKGPVAKKSLPLGFLNYQAVSCIRTIAEELKKAKTSYVAKIRWYWIILNSNRDLRYNTFLEYAVPHDMYKGVIFGGVYFALAKTNSVSTERLNSLEEFVGMYSEAADYFMVFKDALKENIGSPDMSLSSISQMFAPPSVEKQREDFIKSINNNTIQLDNVDWAGATMHFDRKVMAELFNGLHDDNTRDKVVSLIIDTWDRLYSAEDNRCKVVNGTKASGIYKFGGIRITINQFFHDLRAKRDAAKAYSGTKSNSSKNLKTSSPKHTEPEVNTKEIEELKAEIERLQAEVEDLRKRQKTITSTQASTLLLTAAFHGGGLPNNREKLYPVLTAMFSISESLAKRRLREGIDSKRAKDVAIYFDEISPKIARLIREMPEMLKNNK